LTDPCTLRGLIIGIAGLAWHGLGFVSQEKAVKVLEHLREKGPTTKSDLVRYAPRIPKAERDILLERLAAEDLLNVDGTMVTATTYPEFVAALYARDEFPEPRNFLAELSAKAGAVA
jgi:hypothetical protein